MVKKPRFKPEITRVKLNPEQAVLSCSCYYGGRVYDDNGQYTTSIPWLCSDDGSKAHIYDNYYSDSVGSS